MSFFNRNRQIIFVIIIAIWIVNIVSDQSECFVLGSSFCLIVVILCHFPTSWQVASRCNCLPLWLISPLIVCIPVFSLLSVPEGFVLTASVNTFFVFLECITKFVYRPDKLQPYISWTFAISDWSPMNRPIFGLKQWIFPYVWFCILESLSVILSLSSIVSFLTWMNGFNHAIMFFQSKGSFLC